MRRIAVNLDMASFREAEELKARDELSAKRARCIGTFDTGLKCNCDAGTITDQATETTPNARRLGPSEMRFGPGPSIRQQNENFRVFHVYSSTECGATYRNDIIEGKRGYVPQENRPQPL